MSPSRSNVTLRSKASAPNKPGMYQPKDELSRKLIALRYGKDAKRPKKINLMKMKLNYESGKNLEKLIDFEECSEFSELFKYKRYQIEGSGREDIIMNAGYSDPTIKFEQKFASINGDHVEPY